MKLQLRFVPCVLLATLAGVVAGCDGSGPDAPGILMAKGGPAAGPKVTAADPAVGLQGQRLNVRVLGSGYNPTAVASWERNGAPDPKITVHSTTYVSSSEVVADITIGADADTVFYDLGVEILLADGSRKKGVGIEKFQVTKGNNPQQEVPYYVTMWGAVVTNPNAAVPPGEQLVFAWNIQTDTVDLGVRYVLPHAGQVSTNFVNSQADSGSCRKGRQQVPASHVTALLAEFTQNVSDRRGIKVWVNSTAITTGTGSGELNTAYAVTNPSSPFYPGEVLVIIVDDYKTAYGPPKVTRDSTTADGTYYRFHAGFGTAKVWWRGGGPHWDIACRLRDDVYVKVRPGF